MRRLLSAFGVALILVGLTAITVFALPDKPKLGRSQPTFAPDIQLCTGAAATAPSPNTYPLGACAGAVAGDNDLGVNVRTQTAISLPKGMPLSLANSYAGPGYRISRDDGLPSNDTTPNNGVQIGGIQAQIDLFCNNDIDTFGNNTAEAGLDDEQFYKVPVPWTSTSEIVYAPTVGTYPSSNGLYLDRLLPPDAVFDRLQRARADITTIYLDSAVVGGGTALPLTNLVPLNAVWMHPSWSPTTGGDTTLLNTGTSLLLTLLGGNPSVPSNQKLCLQAPQNSLSTFNPKSGGEETGVVGNPAACGAPTLSHCGEGIYVRWTAYLSAPDLTNNRQAFTITQQNDRFDDGTVEADTDADGDGLEDCATTPTGCGGGMLCAVQPLTVARPCESTANDTVVAAFACPAVSVMLMATNADRDCDGLSDGIEIAWGTDPADADTDGDGRDDIEEMFGPGAALTDPTDLDGDTDNDGVPDGGFLAINGTGVVGAGYVSVQIPGDPVSVYADIAGYVKQSVYSGDNCPNIPNGPSLGPNNQDNTGAGRLGYKVGDPGTGWPGQAAPGTGPNGLSTPFGPPVIRADRTNPTASIFGDECNNDIDGDSINDAAEPDVTVGGIAGNICGDPKPTAAPTANYATTGLVHLGGRVWDTDGDGVLDGRECQRGTSNPRDNGYAVDTDNIVSGTGSAKTTVTNALPWNNTETGVTTNWAGLMRVVDIGRDPAGYICGSGRICDLITFSNSTNPCGASCGVDSDGDKIFDGVETWCWGTSPANVDSDRDGLSDAIEILSVDGDTAVAANDFNALANRYFSFGPLAGGSTYPGDNPDPRWEPNIDWGCNLAIGPDDLNLLAGAFNIAGGVSGGTPAQLAP